MGIQYRCQSTVCVYVPKYIFLYVYIYMYMFMYKMYLDKIKSTIYKNGRVVVSGSLMYTIIFRHGIMYIIT